MALIAHKHTILNMKIFVRGAVDNLCKLILKEGPDVWWTRSSEEIIGENLMETLDLRSKKLTKGMVKKDY